MADKTSEWRPGPTVCRCCLAEGCYKDISTEYFWMGKREVYAEMLAETFSVSIAYSKSGGPNSNSRLICEPCISRLRDASDFKKQVQECEKTFMQYLDPGSSSTTLESEVQTSSTDKRVKVEQVKIERQFSDDEFDSRDFGDDDDDDDMDQPLTTFASKEPKKETVNLMELLASPQLSVKRKAPAQTKTVSVKKVKVIKKDARGKPTTSKAAQKNEDKKKKDKSVEARMNAVTVLQYSTGYPLRISGQRLMCVYCDEKFAIPADFRSHMKEQHKVFKEKAAYAHISYLALEIKVDCTELKCLLCPMQFDTLEAMAEHLSRTHEKGINLDERIAIQPFVFRDKGWSCALCSLKFSCLKELSKHTMSHFHKSTCDSCGKSFADNCGLKKHMATAHITGKVCPKCLQVFATNELRWNHVLKSPACWRYICSICGERLMTEKMKTNHMLAVHGVNTKVQKCYECDAEFPNAKVYRKHFVTVHTDSGYECATCAVKFSAEADYLEHKTKHTKERPFQCRVCSKSFPRKKTLEQHMWIHSETKRFECQTCQKKFNQRVTWKTHMKTYHPDFVIL
ncbi:zinc finger protein 652-like isoform X12 [Bombyx mori]|uniref:Uncharacterized protein n=1 Tax=Bombyx mori TaxID=7091 RepID=A0A8R2R9R5_BOMMO|nr:ferritin isoform X14 [Bombyx mori]